jgi:hypothetical protein
MSEMVQKLNGKVEHETETKAPRNRRGLIRELLSKVENGFNVQETKVTLADYIRLTQLERELEEEEQPREIIITWSEPSENRNFER